MILATMETPRPEISDNLSVILMVIYIFATCFIIVGNIECMVSTPRDRLRAYFPSPDFRAHQTIFMAPWSIDIVATTLSIIFIAIRVHIWVYLMIFFSINVINLSVRYGPTVAGFLSIMYQDLSESNTAAPDIKIEYKTATVSCACRKCSRYINAGDPLTKCSNCSPVYHPCCLMQCLQETSCRCPICKYPLFETV